MVLAIFGAYWLGRVEYSTLYQGLTPQQTGEVLAALDDLGVPYKTPRSGTIEVPQKDVFDTQARIAEQGVLSDGFPSPYQAPTGATDLDRQNLENAERQERVRAMIMQIDRVSSCYVMIDKPPDSIFARPANTKDATVSVVLATKDKGPLSQAEVDSIGAIVIGGISGIKPENIHIIDAQANSYYITSDDGNGLSGNRGGTQAERKLALERQLQSDIERQIKDFLSPIFGVGKVAAMVNVRLNFDEVVSESIEFAPPIAGSEVGLDISLSELYETVRDGEAAAGVPGTDTNGVGTTPEYPYGELGEDESYRRVLLERNREINKTTTQIREAQATIDELSVSVMVDSYAFEDEDYSNNVRDLMTTALGIEASRVTVMRMPMGDDATITRMLESEAARTRTQNIKDLARVIANVLIVLLILVFILLLLRMILSQRAEQQANLLAAEAAAAAAASGALLDVLADGELTDGDMIGDMQPGLALNDIDLNSKSEGVLQLESFIERDPQAVAQLLRNWLTDD